MVEMLTKFITGKHLENPGKIVHAGKHDLFAAFGGTEDNLTIVLVLPFTYQEEHLGEVSAGEMHSGNLVVRVDAKVFHKMRIDNSPFDQGRNGIETPVGFVQSEAVLEFDIVGPKQIELQPLVEIVLLDRRIFYYGLGFHRIFLGAGSTQKGKGNSRQYIKYLFHIASSLF